MSPVRLIIRATLPQAASKMSAITAHFMDVSEGNSGNMLNGRMPSKTLQASCGRRIKTSLLQEVSRQIPFVS
jgi:Tfp pilus assembly PilM family ATPase